MKRSTKTTNRRDAQRIADEFEIAARRKRTAIQARRVISELHRSITGADLVQTTVRSFFNSWLERKAPETAPSTHAFYKGAASKFLDYLGAVAETDLTEIDRDRILRFRNDLSKLLAPKTVNHLIKFLRMVFRAAKRDGLLSDDPTEFVETVRQQRAQTRRPFTLDELHAVLASSDEEWKRMILFGIYTGQRLSDIALLKWQNLDLFRGELRLITQKTGKNLVLPLAGPLLRHLNELPRNNDPAVPIHPLAHAVVLVQKKTGHLSNQFADILAKAGLRQKQAHRKTHGKGRGQGSAQKGLSFHCLRHTAVTLLKEAGIPAAVVMELVGHDSEQMSQHYTHVGSDALKKATDALPDLLR